MREPQIIRRTRAFAITRRMIVRAMQRLRGVHSDEEGTISIITVFVMLMFTMLLMMLFNVAKQHDDKVRMQNAADAATYSGGVVLARGMNAIAFTNHLEADVLAVTAFLREARDRNAEAYVPEILQAWVEMSQSFAGSQFPKFQPLAGAIPQTAPLEQQFVTAWSEMAAAAAEQALPAFEHILGTPEPINPTAGDHLIPNFQRAVLSTTASVAQDTMYEMSLRHGLRQEDLESLSQQMRDNPNYGAGDRGPQAGVLWRMSVEPVGWSDETNPLTRTLPVVDPEPYQPDYGQLPNGQAYLDESRRRRSQLAHQYLDQWIRDRDPRKGLDFADEEARMSQFMRLFWTAACAQLEDLLNEDYPNTNVPMILRDWDRPVDNERLDGNYMYVGVVYRRHVSETAPRLFKNPLDEAADAQTFAQATIFIPRRRYHCCPWGWWSTWTDRNGQPQRTWHDYTDGWSHEWSTFNQNWTVKLVPATAERLPEILSSNPGGPAAGYRPANLNGMSIQELNAINTH